MCQKINTFKKTIIKDISLNYLLYLPKNYNEDDKFPLVIFLHGAGERGEDLELVKIHGIPKLIAEGKNFPFIAISPQCPTDSWWTERTQDLNLLIDEILSNYAIDKNRVYLTGMSMGGYGTWKLASEHPEKFAAILPICGGPWNVCFKEKLPKLKELPIWTFHGAKDETVPIQGTEFIVNSLKELGNEARFTIYPEAGHDSWSETYENPEIYEWLLSQSRG